MTCVYCKNECTEIGSHGEPICDSCINLKLNFEDEEVLSEQEEEEEGDFQ